jgi:hypothetical protein
MTASQQPWVVGQKTIRAFPRRTWQEHPAKLFFSATDSPPAVLLAVSSSQTAAMATIQVSLPLPVLPEGWVAEKDFKPLASLSPAVQRNIEPVGPHFLAHARRVSIPEMPTPKWKISY